MKTNRIALAAALLPFLALPLLAQLPPRRPEPTIPAGPREPRPPGPGQVTLPDPCQDFSSQPLITLTLSPAEIYREDSITATWDVRDRRPGIQWAYPVHVETFGAQPAFADPAPRASSHTYSTPSVSGHVTVKTRCGEKRVNWERIPDAFLETVAPVRGPVGTHVTLRGSQFGGQKLASRVEIVRGNQTWTMETPVWGNVSIEAIVPNIAEGPATIRVVKGGRRTTLARDFRVVRTLTVDSALAGLAVASLGLSPGFLHFHHGANASSVTLSAAITGGGASTLNFTVPDFGQNVPAGVRIVQALALPVGIAERVRYRVTDVNSNSLSATVENGRLVLSIGFEGRGNEIKGDLRFCYGAGPICLSPQWVDSLAPDININGARVTLRLAPGVSAGALTFPSAEDSFEANIQIGSDFDNWLLPPLRGYAQDIKTAVRDGVHARLNTAQVRNAIAAAVMARLRNAAPGFHQILSVTPSGNSIVIEYE